MMGVTMRPDVLGWTAQRGCITAPQDLVAAARAGEAVLVVDDDHVLRGVEGDASLAAAIRGDNDTVHLRVQVSGLTARLDDLHDRLVDLAEASIEALARR
jgi:DNA-binding IclR family transcriptional regulator